MDWVSLFGGAGLTAAAGFVGASLQHKREHKRWLRERRYETYVKLSNFLNEIHDLDDDELDLIKKMNIGERLEPAVFGTTSSSKRDLSHLQAGFKGVQSEINLLGPWLVDSKAAEYVSNLASGTEQQRILARQGLLNAMRAQLRIDY